MAIQKDPQGIELSILHSMIDFKGRSVLEVGCGDGRFAWGYADHTSRVLGIDLDKETIETARAQTPERMKERVCFLETTMEDYARSTTRQFCIAIFAWSL